MSAVLPCSKSFMTYYASNMRVTVNANCYLRKGLLNGSIDSLLVASEDCQVSNCKAHLTDIWVNSNPSTDCTFVEAQTGNQWRFSKLKDFCSIPLAPATAPPTTTSLSTPTTAPTPSTTALKPTTTASPTTTPATTETTAPPSSTVTSRPPAPSAARPTFIPFGTALKLAVVVAALFAC